MLLALASWATLLSGAADQADDVFADVADEAAGLGAPDMIAIALAERALIAIGRDEWVRADDLAERAISSARRSRRENAALNAVVYPVAGRTALHRGRASNATDLLANAQRRLPQTTDERREVARLRREVAELTARLEVPAADARRRRELVASRRRILEAGQAERRRIERDLHDSAQQRLVALRIHLTLASERLARPEDRALLEPPPRSPYARRTEASASASRTTGPGSFPAMSSPEPA